MCGLAFLSDGPEPALTELMVRWPQGRAESRSPHTTGPIIDRIFPRRRAGQALSLDLHVPGTNFQIKVWEALLRIPPGVVTTYGGLGEYHWGIPRKHAMLAWEGACIENCTGVADKKTRAGHRRASGRGNHEL